jgi:hypothetical protein
MNQDNENKPGDGLRDEYDETALNGGFRGNYVSRLSKGSNIVRLDPDIAAAFPTEEAVNDALRLLLQTAKRVVEVAQ